MVWGLIRVGLFGGSFLIGLLLLGPGRAVNGAHKSRGDGCAHPSPHKMHIHPFVVYSPSAGAPGRYHSDTRA